MDPKKKNEEVTAPDILVQMTATIGSEVLKFLSKSMSDGSGHKPKKRHHF